MKNKFFVAVLVGVCVCTLLCGCGRKKNSANNNETTAKQETSGQENGTFSGWVNNDEGENVLFLEQPIFMIAKPEEGQWETSFVLDGTGNFSGGSTDDRTEVNFEGAHEGVIYQSDFYGNFKNITKIDDMTYSLELEELVVKNTPGEQLEEDGILYIYTEAYGVEGGSKFTLYLPGTPAEKLSDKTLSNWQGIYTDSTEKTLNCYVLVNENDKQGFFSKQKK